MKKRHVKGGIKDFGKVYKMSNLRTWKNVPKEKLKTSGRCAGRENRNFRKVCQERNERIFSVLKEKLKI